MLDIDIIRNQQEALKEAVINKNGDPAIVDEVVAVDEKWRVMTTNVEELRKKQKELSSNREIEGAKQNKIALKEMEDELSVLSDLRSKLLLSLPNIPTQQTPIGKNEDDNVVVRKWGEPKQFDFPVRDHVEIGERLGLIDMTRATKVSGARFYYFMGDIVRMEYGLVQWVLDILSDTDRVTDIARNAGLNVPHKAFVPIIPPAMIKGDVLRGTGRLTDENEDDKFKLTNDDLYLIGSAEHTVVAMHSNETLPFSELPIRYIAFSPAYRREAGSYGKDTRGIIRVHQFDKLEMVTFSGKEQSYDEFKLHVAIQEYLLQQLNLPHCVMQICTGDMGAPDAEQIDMNTWMPSQGKYRETHTADYNTDFQARRLGVRVKNKDNTTEYAHIGDATAIAMSRILVAILENYQTTTGDVVVPDVLRKYLGKDIISN